MDEKAQMIAALKGDEALMPFGVGSPAEASQQPAGLSNLVGGLYGSLENLAKRAIGNSQTALDTGNYNPAPTLEAALLPMGTGAIAGVPVKGAEAVLGAGPIRAYHGSPHNFDRFDISKIGTGEGAQAYGHGLYFAENPKVAKSYRDALATDPKLNVLDEGGLPVSMNNHPDPMVRDTAEWLMMNQGDPNATAWKLHHLARTYPDAAKDYLKQIDTIRDWQKRGIDFQPGGRTYEVDIHADPSHFLDWKKPREAQSAEVVKALREINPSEYSTSGTMFPPNATGGSMYHSLADNAWHQSLKKRFDPTAPPSNTLYSPENASRILNEHGIPGIKYPDAGSRSLMEKPTNNYVTFDDKIVEILKKYGIAGVPASGVAAGMLQDQGNQ